jgi:hypothetical protein
MQGGSPTCRNRDEHATSPKLNFFPISAIGNNFLDSSCIEAAVIAFLEENLVLEIGLGTRLLSPSRLNGSW